MIKIQQNIKIKQAIIVGLGKQGRKTLEILKERISSTYGDLPAIKLLAIDTVLANPDESGLAASSAILGPSECIDLPLDEIKNQAGKVRKTYSWIPERAVEWSPDWYKTRAAARLSFQFHSREIIDFLELHLNLLGTRSVRDQMTVKGFDITSDGAAVIVIGSLGDLAGSALLVDIAYLIGRSFQRAGVEVSSSALLYMPSLLPSDPISEARAYATLKELSSYLQGRDYRWEYPGFPVESELPPFERGCYLIDTRNEKNLTLKDQAEAVQLGAEWLFRTVFSPLKARVDEYINDRMLSVSPTQQVTYSSLGLATYVLPVEKLIDWSARRLGIDLIQDQLLETEPFSKVSARLTDFFNITHLRPDDLMNEELRMGKDGKPIKLQNEYITRLNNVAYDQIVLQAQATVDEIGKKVLPSLKKQINANAGRVLQDVNEVVKQEIAKILEEWPAGGLSLASQFATRLHGEAKRFSDSLSRREAAFQGRNRQQINHMNELGPLLKNAAGGIPQIYVLILAFLGGVLAPLVLTSIWTWHGFHRLPLLAVFIIILLWLLASASVYYALWQTKNRIDEIRDQYVENLNKRFEAELNLALVQAARSLYPDVINVARQEKERLNKFVSGLQETAHRQRKSLDEITLSGEISFTLQRSVITDEIADELYDHHLGEGGTNARLTPFIAEYGQLTKWMNKPLENFEKGLFDFCQRVFESMRELRVEDLLSRQMSSVTKAEKLVRELEDEAAPLWTYDQFSLGQTFGLFYQSFVGMDAATKSDFKQAFTRVNQSTIFEVIDDPYSIIYTSIRRGIPLHGLRRMHEFRKHYLDVIRNMGEPLHLDDELALSPDVFAGTSRIKLDPPTGFAVGSAFGLVKKQEDGIYALIDAKGNLTGKLAKGRIESAILLGVEEKMMHALAAEIQRTASKTGAKEAVELLQKYKSGAKVSPWETSRIQQFIALLNS
jgi:hypothetical protein